MSPQDFHSLAVELSKRDNEASWRSAASRTYYAAFHVSRDFLDNLGFRIRQTDQAHAAVYRRLSNSKVDEVHAAGETLLDLRRLRNQADYELGRRFLASEAHKAIKDAEYLMSQLDAIRDRKLLSVVAENIRTYERDVLRDVTWRQT